MTIENEDILRFSLDLWREPGLLQSVEDTSGTFYYSPAVQAAEFQFYVPHLQISAPSPELISKIRDFYAEKGCTSGIYCHEDVAEQLAWNKADILFTEVLMRADAEDMLTKNASAADSQTFRHHSDFKDADYRSVYNDVFTLNHAGTEYEQLYQVMADTLHQASIGDCSYKPHIVVGYIDGEAVSMTTIIHKGDMAGIYNVGTKDSHRHQGYAGETMREAFRKAHDLGAKTLFLLTASGSELEKTYQRMGFSPFARHSMVKI